MTDRLNVWLHDRRVGVLARDRRGRWQYVHDAGSPPISIGLPADEPWTPARTVAWFEGLLPEGDQRARMAARFDVAAADTFGLLEQIGWECAGAVAVLPEDRDPAVGTYRGLSDEEVGLRLDALPGRPYDEDDEVRVDALLGGQLRRGPVGIDRVDAAGDLQRIAHLAQDLAARGGEADIEPGRRHRAFRRVRARAAEGQGCGRRLGPCQSTGRHPQAHRRQIHLADADDPLRGGEFRHLAEPTRTQRQP